MAIRRRGRGRSLACLIGLVSSTALSVCFQLHAHRAKLRRGPPALLSGRWDDGGADEGAPLPSSPDRRPTVESLRGLSDCASATQARTILKRVLLDGKDSDPGSAFYNSIAIPPGASSKRISDGDLAIQVRMVNKKYSIMDLIDQSGDRDADRASLAVLCITLASVTSAIAANQNLPGPEWVRFLVVWVFSFSPLAFVGYGIADAEQLQSLLVLVQRAVFPAYRLRMVQHEAGHFLMAHLLGYPIKGYSVNAVKKAVELYPLADTDRGRDIAQQLGFDPQRATTEAPPADRGRRDVPFFSDEGRGALLLEERSVFRARSPNATRAPPQPSDGADPRSAWPYRGLDDAALDQLAVVSVAGICAEILAFGNAEGGAADLRQLRRLFGAAAEAEISEREATDRVRFALGFAMGQLRRHLGCIDALAAVMEREGSVAECVAAIEACDNVSGHNIYASGPDYELERRRNFRSQQVGLFEAVLLGDRSIDAPEDRLVEGKGGGARKQSFRLTGDDPLYAAAAVAFGFLIWASSGGLTLH